MTTGHGTARATGSSSRRALVALYRAEGEADWSAISEMIGETLPEILRRIDARETSSGRLEATS